MVQPVSRHVGLPECRVNQQPNGGGEEARRDRGTSPCEVRMGRLGHFRVHLAKLRKVAVVAVQLNMKFSTTMKIWELTARARACNHWIHDVE